MSKNKQSPISKKQIESYWLQGLNNVDIGKKYNVTKKIVRTWIKKTGADKSNRRKNICIDGQFKLLPLIRLHNNSGPSVVDLTNIQLGDLLVLKLCKRRTDVHNSSSIMWKCQCSCGDVVYKSHKHLLSKNKPIRTCAKLKNFWKHNNLIGKHFGDLIVLKYAGYKKHKGKKYKYHYWLCKCSCGQKLEVMHSSLICKHSKTCGHIKYYNNANNWKGYKDIPLSMFSTCKKGAIDRNIPFKITIQDMQKQWEKQNGLCALTGQKLLIFNRKDKTASLDRIDSNKNIGYTVDNIQWIHKDINLMKWNMNENDFIKLCQQIVTNLNLQSQNDIDKFIKNIRNPK